MEKDMVVGRIVALDGGATKDNQAEAFRALAAAMPAYLENVAILAKYQWAKYLALIKEGFTEAQAIELSKAI